MQGVQKGHQASCRGSGGGRYNFGQSKLESRFHYRERKEMPQRNTSRAPTILLVFASTDRNLPCKSLEKNLLYNQLKKHGGGGGREHDSVPRQCLRRKAGSPRTLRRHAAPRFAHMQPTFSQRMHTGMQTARCKRELVTSLIGDCMLPHQVRTTSSKHCADCHPYIPLPGLATVWDLMEAHIRTCGTLGLVWRHQGEETFLIFQHPLMMLDT